MTNDTYRTSRICYIIEETLAYLITFLIGGAYLARLTISLGFSDSLTAILGSLGSLSCVFQLFAIRIFRRGSVKRRLTILYTISQTLFALLYLVPFLKFPPFIKTALFVAFLLGGDIISNIVASPKTNMFMLLIPDNRRGTFTAFKEAISLICGVIFRYSMGILIDHFDAVGNTSASLITCGLTLAGLMITHTLSLIFAKEKKTEYVDNSSVLRSIRDVISDRKIIPVLIISIMWRICNAVCAPFLGTYQVKELGFSMTYIATLLAVYSAVRIIASFFLGRYADKNSFAKMLKICYGIVAFSFLSIAFTTPSNGHIMFLFYEIFMAVAMGGINSAEINLVFDYVPHEKRRNTLSVRSAICGVCGFLTTFAAAPVVSYVQGSGNKIFGIHMYAQQMLALVSFVMCIVLIIYVDRVVIKNNTVSKKS